MAHQFIGFTGAFRCHRVGPGGVGAHIGTALLFGHAHTDSQRLLFRMRHVTGIIGIVENLRQPFLCQRGRQLDRGHRGKGHGQRAAMARLHLSLQIALCRTGHMGTRPGIRPGSRMNPGLQTQRHQAMVGLVVLHGVHAIALTVVGEELRLVLVGQEAPFDHFRAAGFGSVGRQAVFCPPGSVAAHRFTQGRIVVVGVVVFQGPGLVEDLVGLGQRVRLQVIVLGGHWCSPEKIMQSVAAR